MLNSDLVVTLVLAMLAVLGLASFIVAPIFARRFYHDSGLVDRGASRLQTPADSILLEPLETSHLYQGSIRGYEIEHCKAYPKIRRKFTLNKIKRRHNQTGWSVTKINCNHQIPSFCLLPLSDAATVFLMLDSPGVDLSEDDELSHRYYLQTDYPLPIKGLIMGELRKFLLQRELIFVECADNTVLLKRIWPEDRIKSKLFQDIHCCIDIVDALCEE